jgi:hypothetical protein
LDKIVRSEGKSFPAFVSFSATFFFKKLCSEDCEELGGKLTLKRIFGFTLYLNSPLTELPLLFFAASAASARPSSVFPPDTARLMICTNGLPSRRQSPTIFPTEALSVGFVADAAAKAGPWGCE